MATSLLQDAVEVFLVILVEYIPVKGAKPSDNFPDLLGKLQCIDSVVGYRAVLQKLNKARVSFKHYGLCISSRDEMKTFVSYVDDFLAEVTQKQFTIDFAMLSLIDAIGHGRTRNWLRKAEDALGEGQYDDAVASASAALNIFLRHIGQGPEVLSGVEHYGDDPVQMANWIQDYVESIRDLLIFASRGVEVASFAKFQKLTPEWTVSMDGSLHRINRKPWPRESRSASRDDARFCIELVVDTVLALSNDPIPGEERPWHMASWEEVGPATTNAQCELIVHPDAEPPEVIRMVAQSEALVVIQRRPDRFTIGEPENATDFVSVLEDGDVAYVRRECLDDGQSRGEFSPERAS